MTSIGTNSGLLRRTARVVGAVLAVYLVGRGIGELFVIRPSRYDGSTSDLAG